MTLTVDLNSDMGEGFGPWPLGDDAALLGVVTSAKIAAPRPFNRIILSVAAELPRGCEVAWEVRVGAKWHPLGSFAPRRATSCEGKSVSDETLILNKKEKQ